MRILIVKLGALGDIFYALPAPEYLKNLFKESGHSTVPQIDWLVDSQFKDLLQEHPQIHEVIPFNSKDLYGRSLWKRVKAVLKLRSLVTAKYDAIFIAHRSKAYGVALWGKGPRVLLSRSADSPHFSNSQEENSGTFRSWGSKFLNIYSVSSPPLLLQEGLAIQKLIEWGSYQIFGTKLAAESKPWRLQTTTWLKKKSNPPSSRHARVLLHLGGGQNHHQEFLLKKWPHFQELVLRLLNETPCDIFLVGSPSESEESEALLSALQNDETLFHLPSPWKDRIFNFVGKTSLKELAQLIMEGDLLVGPDSGPLHMADTLQIPAIGLYGPTSPNSWGLLGSKSRVITTQEPCSPCYKDDGYFPPCSRQNICMKNLTASLVLKEVQRALALLAEPEY